MTSKEVIDLLQLTPLPEEGGFYKETFRSPRRVTSETLGDRSECTSIYYLITSDSFSALHQVDQDEIFHFYAGSSVEMFQIDQNGNGRTIIIGNNLLQEEQPQVIVPHGVWQGTKLLNKTDESWALLGCTVSPGFEIENFHIKTRKELIEIYPQHRDNITKFTN